jgi:hypothetical protein
MSETLAESHKRNYGECLERERVHLIELERLQAKVQELEQALRFYRLEHSQNNCYFSGPTGAICDECEAVDKLMAALHAPDKAVKNG